MHFIILISSLQFFEELASENKPDVEQPPVKEAQGKQVNYFNITRVLKSILIIKNIFNEITLKYVMFCIPLSFAVSLRRKRKTGGKAKQEETTMMMKIQRSCSVSRNSQSRPVMKMRKRKRVMS